MKILAQKNTKYTLSEFFSNVINYDYVSGIVLNVVKTSDNVLVVINLSSGEESYVKTVYSNEFLNLKGFEMAPLKEVINYLKRINYKRKVTLNIIPYLPIQLTEEQNKMLFLEYQEYARNLKKIINNSNLDMYIHSVSRSLIELIKKENLKSKLGFAIVGFDLNYIDVDYYVFTVEMLNFPLMKQQLDNSKEIMVYMGTDYEISYLYDIFKGNKRTDLTKEIANNIYLIGNYPEVLNKTFLG
ncbi:MAG: hypothetical protein IJ501_01215 [Bacilli bacterium]|nr:hypothetical protein [Bacilli bacterium]